MGSFASPSKPAITKAKAQKLEVIELTPLQAEKRLKEMVDQAKRNLAATNILNCGGNGDLFREKLLANQTGLSALKLAYRTLKELNHYGGLTVLINSASGKGIQKPLFED